jgi:hypothetical protein
MIGQLLRYAKGAVGGNVFGTGNQPENLSRYCVKLSHHHEPARQRRSSQGQKRWQGVGRL